MLTIFVIHPVVIKNCRANIRRTKYPMQLPHNFIKKIILIAPKNKKSINIQKKY
ncbi:MAG: hypothetical protein H6623_02340 [Bdellovibrionaceae bacterium]|nr:hypothetical protein [Pseudobdellovibrionaceae bacterium]